MSTTSSSSRDAPSKNVGSDIISNLSSLLPTGTFLGFEAVAPLFTNNGSCGSVEKIMTGLLVLTFSVICVLLTFTDSITTTSGKHYYGLVTRKGLYNPQFQGSRVTGMEGPFYNGAARYRVTIFDFVNATLAVVVFDALVLLTPPVSTCYFPRISSTIIKSVPILVGIIAVMYFSFAPPPRRGVGFSITSGLVDTVDETETDHPVTDGTQLLSPAQQKAGGTAAAPAGAKSPV